jgi:hypothetical protein
MRKVLIVGRTRMRGNQRCIGGIDISNGTPIRLYDSNADYFDQRTPYQTGEVWEMATTNPPREKLVPPHVEGRCIQVAERIQVWGSDTVSRAIRVLCPPWEGDVNCLFDGLLQRTGSGSSYISKYGGVPDHSTGFWINSRALEAKDGSSRRLVCGNFGFPFVGDEEMPVSIPAGSLIRVSLARWWIQYSGLEERCYLQISGVLSN